MYALWAAMPMYLHSLDAASMRCHAVTPTSDLKPMSSKRNQFEQISKSAKQQINRADLRCCLSLNFQIRYEDLYISLGMERLGNKVGPVVYEETARLPVPLHKGWGGYMNVEWRRYLLPSTLALPAAVFILSAANVLVWLEVKAVGYGHQLVACVL
jgi:hypothetical protein